MHKINFSEGIRNKSRFFFSLCALSACSFFIFFYFIAYRPGASDQIIVSVLGVLVTAIPILLWRYARNGASPLFFISLFLILFLMWTNIGVILFDPAELGKHFFLTQFYAIAHLFTIAVPLICYAVIAMLCGDVLLYRLLGLREGVSAYTTHALALGILLTALYLYVLSYFSLIYSIALIFPLAVAACNQAGIRYYYHSVRRLWQNLKRTMPVWSYKTLFWATIAISGSIMAVQAGWPSVVEGDSLALYYNLPELIIRHHALVRFPYWPIGDSVYAFGFVYVPLLYIGTKLLNYTSLFFFILTLYPLFYLSRQIRSEASAWLSIWMVAMTPMLIGWLLMTPKIDTLTIFYIVSGLLLLYEAFRKKAMGYAVMAGIYIGFSVALKFNAIMLLPALGFGLLSVGVMYKVRLRSEFTKFGIVFGVVCVASFGLWAARTAYYHQNILYPYSEGRFYDNLISSPEEREYMDAFYQESDYHNANFGFNYSLAANIRNFITSALAHPSFNYGLVLLLAFLSIFLWRSMSVVERAALIVSGAVIIEWYVLVRNEGHYMNFILPLLGVLGAYVVQSVLRSVRGILIVCIVIVAIYNHSFNTLLPSVFIAHAEPGSLLRTFPAYLMQDEVNAIIANDPNAVFLTINAPAPHVVDNHLHRFDNVRNFYLAHVFFTTATPEEAIEQLRSDGITHVIYGEHGADYVFTVCAARGSACPLYRNLIDTANNLRPSMDKVLEKENITIYALRDEN